MIERASFPIQGPILNPTADQYHLEVILLKDAAADLYRRQHNAGRAYELASRWTVTARRKRWQEELAQHRAERLLQEAIDAA